jgi:hypothetical protein
MLPPRTNEPNRQKSKKISLDMSLYHDDPECNLCEGYIYGSLFGLKEINQMTREVLTSSEEMIKLP